MTPVDAVRTEFLERFASTPQCFRAPGRVNLIGEHTDYNAGLVMPAAIQFYTTVAIAARPDRRLRVRSANFAETVEVPLPDASAVGPPSGQPPHWMDYVLGVAQALYQHGVALRGADLLIHGEVPLGAGLSSSAALEVAVALALSTVSQQTLDKVLLARLCQRAENETVGARCGIMDQFASACGRAGYALLIDCRSLEYQLLQLDLPLSGRGPAAQLVACNTMVRHQIAGGEYNRRREECEQGVWMLAQAIAGVETLRDVTPAALRAAEARLDPVIYRRCRHVVSENERVRAAAIALGAADLVGFGRLMRDSHRSLRDDYEVSCDELDLMVGIAESIDGVYGARMTGGGFGGCTVNLVRADAVPHFRTIIAERYAQATGHTPEIYVCQTADGAAPVGP